MQPENMSDMKMFIRSMRDRDEAAVIALWERAGLTRPFNEVGRDIRFGREGETSDILVGLLGEKIVASVLVGHDGHRGNVYYVATDPDCRAKGLGRDIMTAAESWLRERGVWKLNLMVRASNEKVRGFYEAIGYVTQPRTVFTKWLEEPPESFPGD